MCCGYEGRIAKRFLCKFWTLELCCVDTLFVVIKTFGFLVQGAATSGPAPYPQGGGAAPGVAGGPFGGMGGGGGGLRLRF